MLGLRRKHGGRRALWSDYPMARYYERYGLWPMPLTAGWTAKTPTLNARGEASREAGYGKSVRFDEGRSRAWELATAACSPSSSAPPTLPRFGTQRFGI